MQVNTTSRKWPRSWRRRHPATGVQQETTKRQLHWHQTWWQREKEPRRRKGQAQHRDFAHQVLLLNQIWSPALNCKRKSSQQTHRPNLITSQAHHSIHQKWWKKSFEFAWIFKPANTHTARVINAAASISKCAIMWRCLMKTIHVINAINHDKSLRSNKCLQLVWHVFIFFFFRIFFIIALGRCPNRSSLVLFLHFPVIFLSLSGFAITFSLSETN